MRLWDSQPRIAPERRVEKTFNYQFRCLLSCRATRLSRIADFKAARFSSISHPHAIDVAPLLGGGTGSSGLGQALCIPTGRCRSQYGRRQPKHFIAERVDGSPALYNWSQPGWEQTRCINFIIPSKSFGCTVSNLVTTLAWFRGSVLLTDRERSRLGYKWNEDQDRLLDSEDQFDLLVIIKNFNQTEIKNKSQY